jgi:hypothetical protein
MPVTVWSAFATKLHSHPFVQLAPEALQPLTLLKRLRAVKVPPRGEITYLPGVRLTVTPFAPSRLELVTPFKLIVAAPAAMGMANANISEHAASLMPHLFFLRLFRTELKNRCRRPAAHVCAKLVRPAPWELSSPARLAFQRVAAFRLKNWRDPNMRLYPGN